MRKSVCFVFGAGALALLLSDFSHPVTSAEKVPAPPVLNAPADAAAAQRPAPLDPALEEIMRIREATGSPLRGSILENLLTESTENGEPRPKTAMDAFAETLKRLSTEPRAPLPEPVPPADSDPPPALLTPEPSDTGDVDFIPLLRVTARTLDAKANDLEDQRLYEDAKRLRKLSKQLRSEARRYEVQ